jgi:hypothetical protein
MAWRRQDSLSQGDAKRGQGQNLTGPISMPTHMAIGLKPLIPICFSLQILFAGRADCYNNSNRFAMSLNKKVSSPLSSLPIASFNVIFHGELS